MLNIFEEKISKEVLVLSIDLFSTIKLLMEASCKIFPLGQAKLGISFQTKDNRK
jgi:hypothetical protein